MRVVRIRGVRRGTRQIDKGWETERKGELKWFVMCTYNKQKEGIIVGGGRR